MIHNNCYLILFFLSECECNEDGSVNELCDEASGKCTCKENVIGDKCTQCATEFWGIISNCEGISTYLIKNGQVFWCSCAQRLNLQVFCLVSFIRVNIKLLNPTSVKCCRSQSKFQNATLWLFGHSKTGLIFTNQYN